MTTRRTGARAARIDPRPIFAWLAPAVLGLMVASAAAHGQTDVPPEKVAPKQKVTSPAVIHPPAHIDPAIRVPPPSTQHFPTPVIKPQAKQGDTVVVPK
jgi:hypothetical protein